MGVIHLPGVTKEDTELQALNADVVAKQNRNCRKTSIGYSNNDRTDLKMMPYCLEGREFGASLEATNSKVSYAL